MSGKGAGGKAPRPAAARRRGLLIFGAVFIALFAVVAISEGIGTPSVPSGSVALVEGVPSEIGDVTEAQFEQAIELASKQSQEKEVPKPGSKKYEALKETALSSIIEPIWLQGEAEESGIEVSEAEVAKELKKLKKESFKSEAEFNKFLKESGFTAEDVNARVKSNILSTKLQEQLKEQAPKPSKSQIEAYYEAAKATEFTQEAGSDVRFVVSKEKKKADEAFEALSKDDSAKSWREATKKYSEGPTKENAGLKRGIKEGEEEEPLNSAIFAAPEQQVEGPIKTASGYTVFEVVNSNPEIVQSLKTVEKQIQATLEQREEQEYFTNFVANFTTKWLQRTHCATGFVTKRCANYKFNGRPPTAPETCFEADPKGGRPEACPAVVNQLVPALPGSVTPLVPAGEPLPQRPHPAGEGEEEETPGGLEGLPEGAVPPTEAPPSEEGN